MRACMCLIPRHRSSPEYRHSVERAGGLTLHPNRRRARGAAPPDELPSNLGQRRLPNALEFQHVVTDNELAAQAHKAQLGIVARKTHARTRLPGHDRLEGRTVCTAFFEPSTRTASSLRNRAIARRRE